MPAAPQGLPFPQIVAKSVPHSPFRVLELFEQSIHRRIPRGQVKTSAIVECTAQKHEALPPSRTPARPGCLRPAHRMDPGSQVERAPAAMQNKAGYPQGAQPASPE
ncbi:hypothetical protein [Streptomyces sp. NPDC059489]|uniref:hypothetical protein n=1 Tax=Streptomyces sp. NPDC059489 TaxID=3346849 RepID=UPI0036B25A9E